MASTVENALYLGQVVPMDQRRWRGRIKLNQNPVFFEIGVQPLLNVNRFNIFV